LHVTALIEVKSLTKYYRMGESVVRALDGVDITIERGDFVAITGASGSGKSTLMHVIGCLDRPTGGTYDLDNRDVSNLSDRELAAVRNEQIGFVFQTFNLINRTSAAENVGVPLFYARKNNTRSPALVALERVGLKSRASHNPNELSGGERQRVAIARAIVNNPPLLLADEPTGNLDSRTGAQIMSIFRSLNAEGVTIVMVTHEPDIAEQARRIIFMRDGKIVSDRLTEDILRAEGRTRPVLGVTDDDDDEPPAESGPGEPGEPVVAEASSAESRGALQITARLAQGANAALTCGLTVLVLWLAAVVIGVVLNAQYPRSSYKPTSPPTPVIVGNAIASLSVIASIVLGILAIVFSRKALGRARIEPGEVLGRRRAVFGQILGWVGAVGVPVLVVGSIAYAVWRGEIPPMSG
jgi:putative ABC transport system ATP-binding protein